MDATTGAFFVLGLGLLVLGAEWLVKGASRLAAALGVSPLAIGLTVVAYGTSSPEMAVSVKSALAMQADIAVGNVVGSNIFNILAVLGLSGLVARDGIPVSPAVATFDAPVMIAVAVACLPIFASGSRIARWEGALFLFFYLAYTAYLVLAAQQHGALPAYNAVMGAFVLPLTAVTLVVIGWRAWRERAA